ncbi:hypothetical protein [Actinoplanes siamensis]|uniref:Uncharacterized protein n=1 Tax=Actinoplanes siamensis TaxID=1223317 RepID=A0A919TPI8_9ACTN|nr:hypothetical protein [Actinoplanes siamensis]GIF09832.1 hypothetical protein Asi03nite_73700 [Actinoplanes siamensis]
MNFVEVVIDRPIGIDRDDVEDALELALGGMGEVTGAGTSATGSHLDLEVNPDADRAEVLRLVFGVIEDLGVGDSARVRPGDGEEWFRLSDWNG